MGSAQGIGRRFLDAARSRPDLAGLIPALVLAGHFYGTGAAAVFALFALPYLMMRHGPGDRAAAGLPPAFSPRERLLARLDAIAAGGGGRQGACLALGIEDFAPLLHRLGAVGSAALVERAINRLSGALRDEDQVFALEGGLFIVALGPGRRLTSDSLSDLAMRLCAALCGAAGDAGDAGAPPLRASVGACLSGRAPEGTGVALLGAAEQALAAARAEGPGTVALYTQAIGEMNAGRQRLREDLAAALEHGEIVAYFQPQVSTETGAATGFEALARWAHPSLGLLPPARFMPLIAEAGLSARLGEVMLFQALSALRVWDAAGLAVDTVSVNFSTAELARPGLAARVAQDLARFAIAPARLSVEILESVVTDDPDPVVAGNIAALSQLGCGLELDDFGTGHASIGSIRRFAVNRLKIDRSLVARADTDAGQRRILSAILSMAETLGVATIAEGVETPGEHAIVAQLGCGHVQGYAVGRPMPLAETAPWLDRHRRAVATASLLPGRG